MTQALLRPQVVVSGCAAAARRVPSSSSSKFSPPHNASSRASALSSRGVITASRGRRGGSVILAAAVGEEQQQEQQRDTEDEDAPRITQDAANNIVAMPKPISGDALEVVKSKFAEQKKKAAAESPALAQRKPLPKKTNTNKKTVRVQIIKNVSLDLEPDATLQDAKAMIEEQEGIAAEDQVLYFEHKRLPEDFPVSDLARRSTLVMRLRGEEIFIKTFAGTTSTLNFNPEDSVGEVLAKLAGRVLRALKGVNTEAADMRLRFAGEVLDDEACILADYGVQRDSTLFLDRAVRVSVKDTYDVPMPSGGLNYTIDEADDDDYVEEEEEKADYAAATTAAAAAADTAAADVVAVDVWSSSTVGDVLDAIVAADAEKGAAVDRRRVKLTEGKPGVPIRGFHRLLDESKTLAEAGFDENTNFVLERKLDIRVFKLRNVMVEMWTYEEMDEIFRKLMEKCPEKLAGALGFSGESNYNTASEFLSGCRQTKAEVLRSRTFYN